MDILPNTVSSVYLIRDPEYRKLSVGLYASLHEASVAREMGKFFYCLGFLVPRNSKMEYKAEHGEPELLDMVLSHAWHSPLDLEQLRNDRCPSGPSRHVDTTLPWGDASSTADLTVAFRQDGGGLGFAQLSSLEGSMRRYVTALVGETHRRCGALGPGVAVLLGAAAR